MANPIPFNWIITKCRAKFKGHKEDNYTFYIVDYVYGKWPTGHVTELRYGGLVKTKHFKSTSAVGRFIYTEGERLSFNEANDKVFVKSIKKFRPVIIDNMFGKNKEVSK